MSIVRINGVTVDLTVPANVSDIYTYAKKYTRCIGKAVTTESRKQCVFWLIIITLIYVIMGKLVDSTVGIFLTIFAYGFSSLFVCAMTQLSNVDTFKKYISRVKLAHDRAYPPSGKSKLHQISFTARYSYSDDNGFSHHRYVTIKNVADWRELASLHGSITSLAMREYNSCLANTEYYYE